MSRIPPHNVRLTSGTLKFKTSGSSPYFFQSQLKQQLSLQQSIIITRQALQWRVIQNKSNFDRNIHNELLPLITRLRCRWDIKSQIIQNQAFYHNRWLSLAPVMFGFQLQNPAYTQGHKGFSRNAADHQPKQIQSMFKTKTYRPNLEQENLKHFKLEFKGHCYGSNLHYILGSDITYRTLKQNFLHTDIIDFNMCASLTWSSLWWQAYNTVCNKTAWFKTQTSLKSGKSFSYGNINSVAFSLFCHACIAQGIFKPGYVYKLGSKLIARASLLTDKTTSYDYDHVSKVALGYANLWGNRDEFSMLYRNKSRQLTIQAKDQTREVHSPLEFALNHGFNSFLNLNLFGFEQGHFAKAKQQKTYLRSTERAFKFKPESRSKQYGGLNISQGCFDYKKAKTSNAQGLFYGYALNTYVNFWFNMQNTNSEETQPLTSGFSLRL